MVIELKINFVIIVDDYKLVYFIICIIVSFFGFKEICELFDGDVVYEVYLQCLVDFIIFDLKMLGFDGLLLFCKICWECMDKCQRVKVIVLLVGLDCDMVMNVCDVGVDVLIVKLIIVWIICECVF